VQNGNGYSTPPGANGGSNGAAMRQPSSRSLYQLVPGDGAAEHGEPNGTATENGYAVQSGLNGVSMSSQTPPQTYGALNGNATPSSNKRARELDDDEEASSRPSSRGHDERPGEAESGAGGGMKRRKTIREGSTPSAGMGNAAFDRNSDSRLNRTRSAVPRVRR
jgi:protein SOK2